MTPELGRALAVLGLLVSITLWGEQCLGEAAELPACLRTRPPECRYARGPP